ncbi:alpha/beta hydrolase family protein [Sunxiuqinia indica]|uniref:alpha/beta hydrolase family protein n=1 Tax=Sunxiuqinia indica TaxID=2692584 RepID=UPI00135CA795|nr:acetylxylan esterase [Sunxiuqinia indica]
MKDKVWIKYTDNQHALYQYIYDLAGESLDDRQVQISKLQSVEDWRRYLEQTRDKLTSPVAKFEKTPLNARITGKLERENFRVEKIVYESHPGFYVTGSLFIPKNMKNPRPAILYSVGHSQNSFRNKVYQISIHNLVTKGFVVFSFDPIGQGERTQYLNEETQKSNIGGSTQEHSFAGGQCLLAGYSINDYFLWDGIRALDYLSSRPEVDATRIGMTGRSGGGQQTAMLSAVDKRIYASAPECYITSHRRLLESIGPQDAEQNMFNGLKLGIDHSDLLMVRAPKPTMIITTTQDFFSIQGARETYANAKEIFGKLGHSENMTMVEADGPHTTRKKNRESMYRFFQKKLELPGSSEDLEIDLFPDEELQASPTGQVTTSYQSKIVFDLNKDLAGEYINQRSVTDPSSLNKNKNVILQKVKELSGYDPDRKIESVVFTGKIEKRNYKIEKYFIQSEDFEYPIPFVFIKPYSNDKRPLLMYFNSTGKEELLKNEAEIEKYIEKGYSILAADVLGTGELKNTDERGDAFIQGVSYNLFIGANLVGKSIAGIQASDMQLLFNYIKQRPDVDPENITSLVKDELCSSYLHFAAFQNEIDKTILVNPLVAFEDIINRRYYHPKYIWTAVPGAVQYYDLSYLEASLAPSELIIINPVNAKGETVSQETGIRIFSFPKKAFALQGADDKIKTLFSGKNNQSEQIERIL